MLHRILLPIDGSSLSERAIGPAEALARAQGAEVILARVVEPAMPAWASSEDLLSGDEQLATLEETLAAEARLELAQVAERVRADGLRGEIAVLRGSAASALLNYETETRADLVVMATHGRTGLARFVVGSVADRLVQEGSAPVLLVRPFSPVLSSIERALVPLDGSPVAEEALPMVEALASKPLRTVRLLRAIASEDERQEAGAYLQLVAGRLSAAGLAVEADVRRDAPAHAIETAAKDVDVVIMATHGRGGLERLRHGNVAEQATRHLATPVLLVHAAPAKRRVDLFPANVTLFRDFDQKHLDMVRKLVHERSYPAGEAIIRQGEPGIGVYIIRSGRVEVLKEIGGREEHVATLGPGELFGEISLLTDRPRTATVKALEATECLVLTAWNFRALLDEAPDLAKQLLFTLAQRLVDTDNWWSEH